MQRPASRRKGIGLIFPNPDSERARGWRRCWQRRPSMVVVVGGARRFPGRNRGDASEPGDVAESPGKSSLFFVKDRVRGIGSSGDTEKVPVERRGSGGVRCAFGGPGKSGSGFFAALEPVRTHHPQQVSKVYSLSSMASM